MDTKYLSISNDCTIDVFEGLSSRTDYTGHSLLHWAVHNGDLKICDHLLSKNVFVDKQDSFGTTPLMLASYYGFKKIVMLLLENGADPELKNDYEANSLTMACASDNEEILKILISHWKSIGKDDHDKMFKNLLIMSAACGSKNCVECICIDNKDSVNSINESSGMNALMLAESGQFKHVKEVLISKGGEKNPLVVMDSLETTIPYPLIPLQEKSFLFPVSPFCSPSCSYHNSSFIPSNSPASLSLPFQLGSDLLKSNESLICNNPINYLTPKQCKYPSKKHPLTPNLCFSPYENKSRPFDQKKTKLIHSWFKKLKRKRSRSVEHLKFKKRKSSGDIETDNILDYILSSANLSEYKKCFTEHEVTFRTFITLNEDELVEAGIKKVKDRKKLMRLINHYKRIFSHKFL